MAETTHKLVGQNYSTSDLVAKVTGKAKYSEDYRAEGMLYARLLTSPYPHARVRSINATAALAMPGVKAILTPDEIPGPAATVTDLGQTIQPNLKGERALASEPVYRGEPVLAVCAVDDLTAAEAIERIEVDWEPLPFNVDPLDSLRPGRPTARSEGNVWIRPEAKQGQPPPPPEIQEIKWTDEQLADAKDGKLPMGKATDEWSYGDVEAGFKKAALVLDETFLTPNNSHQTLEPRTAMAYWQNGKLYMHCSTQSTCRR
jgi:CO/xanthine dehydrogenase Mo-binding subunit